MMSYLCTQPPRILRLCSSRMTTGAAQNQSSCRRLLGFCVRIVNRPSGQRAFFNLERHLFVTHGALRFSSRPGLFKKLWNVFNKQSPRLSILYGLLPTCYMRCQ
jgi:hypothetical protein